MNIPCIVACGAYTALGNLDETWERLCAGHSGLQHTHIEGLEIDYPVGLAKNIDGKLDSFSRLMSLLEHALYDNSEFAEMSTCADCIVTTTKGAADELLEANSTGWRGQPWQLDKIVGRLFHCNGKIQIISAACTSGAIGLFQAASQVKSGISETVLVLGIDIISKFVISGFAGLQALSHDPCRPFDRFRSGLSLGEGLGLVIVASKEIATKRGWPILAVIEGGGISCDANHITAPCRQGSGLLRVFQEIARENRKQVGAINAHGTGTIHNDAMELTAINTFWKDDPPPIHSIKGCIGHCLGAAGVIEAAIAVMSLKKGLLPPTVGLNQPENIMPVGSCSKVPQPLPYSSIISCNSGFGGINAGILLTSA